MNGLSIPVTCKIRILPEVFCLKSKCWYSQQKIRQFCWVFSWVLFLRNEPISKNYGWLSVMHEKSFSAKTTDRKFNKIPVFVMALILAFLKCWMKIFLFQLSDTLNLVRMIETTGVKALGVHGRFILSFALLIPIIMSNFLLMIVLGIYVRLKRSDRDLVFVAATGFETTTTWFVNAHSTI